MYPVSPNPQLGPRSQDIPEQIIISPSRHPNAFSPAVDPSPPETAVPHHSTSERWRSRCWTDPTAASVVSPLPTEPSGELQLILPNHPCCFSIFVTYVYNINSIYPMGLDPWGWYTCRHLLWILAEPFMLVNIRKSHGSYGYGDHSAITKPNILTWPITSKTTG